MGMGSVFAGKKTWGELGLVLVKVTGKLCESDEGGVAGIGVGGGDKGDECLGNEEMSLSMFSSGSKDETGAVV